MDSFFTYTRKQVVRINGVKCHAVSVKSGVPQSVLGPLLFLVLIGDI